MTCKDITIIICSKHMWTHDWEVTGSTPGRCTVRQQQLWASCQHPCASVTKQYNLVAVKGRWCSAVRKETVGLASHWPCITDFSGLSTYGLTATKSTPLRSNFGTWYTF